MVIVSPEVEDALLDIHFQEFAYNVNTPDYYALKKKLFSLDQGYINRIPGRYPAWQRMGWFEVTYKQHIFGYSWDGENVVIHEYYRTKESNNESIDSNRSLLESKYNATNKFRNMNNKKVVRLTESQLHNIIVESVNQILMELDPRTYASYADKRRQQAKQSSNYGDMSKYTDKAEQGEQMARDAWNKKYAYDETRRNGLNYQYGRRVMINTNDDPYTTHMQSFTNGIYGDEPKHYVSINNKGTDDANRIATQMRDGTGKYIKGKGWQ